MSTSTTKIIKAIRSKYTGTAEEHDLLRDLESSFDETCNRVREEEEYQIQSREEAIRERERELSSLEAGKLIDLAVYRWLNPGTHSQYAKEELIDSLQGRGLTIEKMEELVKHMRETTQEQS